MFSETSKPFSLFKIKDVFLSYGIYFIFILIVAFFTLKSDAFFTGSNIIGILQNSNALMLISVGLTFVILIGALDLSVGSVAYVAGALTMLFINRGVPIWISLLIGILSGVIIGLINATLVSILNMNPMLITLGMMIALRGVALQLTNGRQIILPEELKKIGVLSVGPIPVLVLIVLAVTVLSQIILVKTTFGRHLIATGSNAKGATKIGISTTAIKYIVFVLSSSFAAIAGIISMINMGAVVSSLGKGMEFSAVSAVVLGGTSLFGGKGSFLPGTVLGVLILAIIENGLNIIGVSPFLYPFAQGLIIFAAMYADSLKYKKGIAI